MSPPLKLPLVSLPTSRSVSRPPSPRDTAPRAAVDGLLRAPRTLAVSSSETSSALELCLSLSLSTEPRHCCSILADRPHRP